MRFDGCPLFTVRDGRLYRVLPDGSEVLYWSRETGFILNGSERKLGGADDEEVESNTAASRPLK